MIPKHILQKIRQIEIRTKHLVNEVFSGEYQSVFKGRGMEFSEVREYQPGDEIRSIDWNVTSRLGRPYIKHFIEERELNVILMADISGSKNFGTVNQLKGEIAAEICAILASAAIKNNDRVGLLMFTDQVEKFIPPKKGRTHILRVIREVLYSQPEHKGTDIAQALDYLNRLLTRRSIVFIISDFLDTEYLKQLRVASKRHDVIAINITDPREIELPKVGLIQLEDAESGEEIVIDTSAEKWRSHYREYNILSRNQRDQQFRSIGVDAIHIQTEQSYMDPLLRFFRKRERKLIR